MFSKYSDSSQAINSSPLKTSNFKYSDSGFNCDTCPCAYMANHTMEQKNQYFTQLVLLASPCITGPFCKQYLPTPMVEVGTSLDVHSRDR